MPNHHGRRRLAVRAAAVTGCASLLSALAVAGATPGSAAATASAKPLASAVQHDGAGNGCQLGNGVKHVIELGFDNVHYFRDNPNVPSDMEMIPNLLNFIEQNGTLLSNNHTPLIAHTADDLLTTFTGLYGDRQGMPVSNAYQAYNADGSTDPADSFAYWTDPVDDTASTPNPGHDANPSLVYSATPPATTTPAPATDVETPAPWVPFTRAGCNVGEVATVDQELETSADIVKVFGAGSPEAQQLAADPDSYKDPETADYIGLAIHCAKASAVCANAEAVKYGQTTPSHTAVSDLLPDEPGGYSGYQALFGAKYIDPVLGAGTPDLTRNGDQITNAKGNIVDLDGNEIDGEYLSDYPGFPGYGDINAPQALAYSADMLESGVQVVDLYMSDIHGNDGHPQPLRLRGALLQGSRCSRQRSACYIAQAQYYNQAFGSFFKRLAADGITPSNTLFIFSSTRVTTRPVPTWAGLSSPPRPPVTAPRFQGDSVTPDVSCTYPAGTFGELAANINGLLGRQETTNTTPFSLEPDTAPEFYVTGHPGPDTPAVRSLEHDVASLTARIRTRATATRRSSTTWPTRPKRRSCTWSTPTRLGRRRSPSSPSPTTTSRPARVRALWGRRSVRHGLDRLCSARRPLRLGPRRLRRRDQHQLGRLRRPGCRRNSVWTATAQRRSRLGRRQQRPGRRCPKRDDRDLGRRDRHPAHAACT